MSQCKQTPGTRLGTSGGLTKTLSLCVWAPKVPPGLLADGQVMVSEFAPQKIPGPPSQLGGLVWEDVFLSVLGLNSQPWCC